LYIFAALYLCHINYVAPSDDERRVEDQRFADRYCDTLPHDCFGGDVDSREFKIANNASNNSREPELFACV
ncbi:MAG: hypothetical protein ABJA70_23645, partial [Chryseolinea sp.]